jgi:chromosome segregation ATPase
VPAKAADQALHELKQRRIDLANVLRETEQLRTDKVLLQSELSKVCIDAATNAAELKSINSELRRRNIELVELREQLGTKEKAIDDIRRRLETAERDREELNTQLARSARDLQQHSDQNSDLRDARERVKALCRERDEMRTALAEVRSALQSAEEQRAREIAHWQTIATNEQARVSGLEKEREAFAAKNFPVNRDSEGGFAAHREELDAAKKDAELARQENAKLQDSLVAAARDCSALKNEARFASDLAEKRQVEIDKLGSRIAAHDAQLADASAVRTQLAHAERQIASLNAQYDTSRSDAEKARADAAALQAELARVMEKLRHQDLELRQARERAVELDRQRTELQKRVDDPLIPTQLTRISEELTSVNAELGRVRLALESVTAERNAARIALTERDAALRQNAEATVEQERKLGAAHAKIEALLRRLEEFEAKKSAPTAPPEDVSEADDEDPDADPEERYHQLESELERMSERLRDIKTERFQLRERLAVKQAELANAPPNSDGAAKIRSELSALQRQIEQSQPAAERARKEYEALQTKLRAARPAQQATRIQTPLVPVVPASKEKQ